MVADCRMSDVVSRWLSVSVGVKILIVGARQNLNMELDLQSFFGLHVHSCTHWLRPRNSPLPHQPPAFGLKYEGAIGQPK
jgi:hypothetical protein